MQLKLDKRFWVVITCIIVVFTIFIVGRNLLHAIEIRKDIAILEQERAIYRARIEQDSTLLEELKYDDNLEQFARERYRMQRRGESLYRGMKRLSRRVERVLKIWGCVIKAHCCVIIGMQVKSFAAVKSWCSDLQCFALYPF